MIILITIKHMEEKNMSNVNVNNKVGHPVAGIVLGILGITVALLMTLLFGVIAGAVAAALGLGAALLGFSARKKGNCGIGAIVAGALAPVLAVTMTFASVGTMKKLKDTAVASGVAPTFARYMENPYMGLSSVVMNAVSDKINQDAAKTLQTELDALNQYMANNEKPAAETAPSAA